MVARLTPSPPDVLGSLYSLRAEARADMPRALLLASFMVATLFAALGASRPWWAGSPPIEVVDLTRIYHFQPPPALEESGGAAPLRVSTAPAVDPHAVVRAVPFEPPTEVEVVGPSVVPSNDAGTTTGTPQPGPVSLPVASRPAVDVVPDVWETHDIEPEPLFTPKPSYTDLAQQAGVEGTVVLRALVERDGSVGEIRIERSVPLLNESARSAIARWTFTPARTGGVAVRAWVLIPVRFSLRDGR